MYREVQWLSYEQRIRGLVIKWGYCSFWGYFVRNRIENTEINCSKMSFDLNKYGTDQLIRS